MSFITGYHGHGTRWEQLAIGCWGETLCLDMDMGCVPNTITDIRMLFTKGVDEKLWTWSDAGWGGDWLKVFDSENHRLMPFSWKRAYESHGPCLTCMKVDGLYKSSNDDQVAISSIVRTLRTDDYARTFISLSYVFKNDLPADKSSLFSLGGAQTTMTPVVVYGCKDGLIKEVNVGKPVEFNEIFMEIEELGGDQPWFVGFPGK